MIILLSIIGYFVVMACILLWDAFVGFSINFGTDDLGVAAMLWPIGLPIILCVEFFKALDRVKKTRLNKRNEKEKKIRLALEEKTLQEKREADELAIVELALKQGRL